MKAAVIYCRTDHTGWAHSISLIVQAAFCIVYCLRIRVRIAEIVFDAGQSAMTLKRPGLTRILRLAKKRGNINVIVTTRDRFSQDLEHWRLITCAFIPTRSGVLIAGTQWRRNMKGKFDGTKH
jgi:DNA invertase Pin-like site-specific DNA recombinase